MAGLTFSNEVCIKCADFYMESKNTSMCFICVFAYFIAVDQPRRGPPHRFRLPDIFSYGLQSLT